MSRLDLPLEGPLRASTSPRHGPRGAGINGINRGIAAPPWRCPCCMNYNDDRSEQCERCTLSRPIATGRAGGLAERSMMRLRFGMMCSSSLMGLLLGGAVGALASGADEIDVAVGACLGLTLGAIIGAFFGHLTTQARPDTSRQLRLRPHAPGSDLQGSLLQTSAQTSQSAAAAAAAAARLAHQQQQQRRHMPHMPHMHGPGAAMTPSAMQPHTLAQQQLLQQQRQLYRQHQQLPPQLPPRQQQMMLQQVDAMGFSDQEYARVLQAAENLDGVRRHAHELAVAQQISMEDQGGRATQPADRTYVEALPVHIVTSDEVAGAPDDHKSCTICLEEFQEGDRQRTLPCFHRFHKRCVDRWLQQNGECPMCKHRVDGGGDGG